MERFREDGEPFERRTDKVRGVTDEAFRLCSVHMTTVSRNRDLIAKLTQEEFTTRIDESAIAIIVAVQGNNHLCIVHDYMTTINAW